MLRQVTGMAPSEIRLQRMLPPPGTELTARIHALANQLRA
jgi:hypothetical protein